MISEPCESDMRVPWRLRKTSIDRTIRVRTMNRMIEQKGAEVAENPSDVPSLKRNCVILRTVQNNFAGALRLSLPRRRFSNFTNVPRGGSGKKFR